MRLSEIGEIGERKLFLKVAAHVADRLSPFKHLAGGVQVRGSFQILIYKQA